MAIWKVVTAVIAAAFIASTPAHAEECIPFDTYYMTFAEKGFTLYGSPKGATEKMLNTVNDNRSSAGRSKISASIVLVSYVKDDKGEVSAIVGIFDKNGCLIEDTFVTLTLRQWLDFLANAGVEPKEFVEIDNV